MLKGHKMLVNFILIRGMLCLEILNCVTVWEGQALSQAEKCSHEAAVVST
jgi:hypothetical protein